MANKIIVQDTPITIISDGIKDYISLTDMAGAKQDGSRAADIIKTGCEPAIQLNFSALGN